MKISPMQLACFAAACLLIAGAAIDKFQLTVYIGLIIVAAGAIGSWLQKRAS